MVVGGFDAAKTLGWFASYPIGCLDVCGEQQ